MRAADTQMIPTSIAAQVRAIAAVASRRELHTVVLRDPLTLSWLTGARWHVQHSLHNPCFDLVITDLDAPEPVLLVVTSVIEGSRLMETELDHLADDCEVLQVPWTQDRSTQLPRGPGVGSDVRHPERLDISAELAPIRRQLTPEQRRTLRELTRDAATCLSRVARTVVPGQRERDIAARIHAELVGNAMDPLVCLVGVDDRLVRHKHPLPTDERFRYRAMLSAGVRRSGVCTSVTRYVSTGALSRAEASAYRRLLTVESAFLDATQAGARLCEPLLAGARAYGDAGLDAGEWTRHHQGGIAGFAPREVIATPQSPDVLIEGTAVAWNPSAEGWKVESVTLIDTAGPRLIAEDPTWPTVEIDGRPRPAVLEL